MEEIKKLCVCACVCGGGRFEHLGGASVMTSQQVCVCVKIQERKITGNGERSVCVCVLACCYRGKMCVSDSRCVNTACVFAVCM